MELLFELFKGVKITYPKFEGVVCGYNEANFILAVETKSMDFFRTLNKEDYILEEYKDPKYRYILEDESAIEKQLKKQKYNGSTQENQSSLQQTGGSNGEAK